VALDGSLRPSPEFIGKDGHCAVPAPLFHVTPRHLIFDLSTLSFTPLFRTVPRGPRVLLRMDVEYTPFAVHFSIILPTTYTPLQSLFSVHWPTLQDQDIYSLLLERSTSLNLHGPTSPTTDKRRIYPSTQQNSLSNRLRTVLSSAIGILSRLISPAPFQNAKNSPILRKVIHAATEVA
jgi:hypothetical protein